MTVQRPALPVTMVANIYMKCIKPADTERKQIDTCTLFKSLLLIASARAARPIVVHFNL